MKVKRMGRYKDEDEKFRVYTVHLMDKKWAEIGDLIKLGETPNHSEFIRDAINEKLQATWQTLVNRQKIVYEGK